MELPDFHIPHAEKIEWMIETEGWALEAVPAQPAADPPTPGYAYSIGLPASFGYAEVVVFGLKPSAASGLLRLVAGALRGGTEIPTGVELVGLFDNDLRCFFAPVDLTSWAGLFATATAWYAGEPYAMVQLLYPDRNGFMPYEDGFDQQLRPLQPLIGTLDG